MIHSRPLRNTAIIFSTTALLLLFSYVNGLLLGVTQRSLAGYLIPIVIGMTLGSLWVVYLRLLEKQKQKEKDYFYNMAEALATALGEKDIYTHGHSRRVTDLTLRLGANINLNAEEMDNLQLAALLHDIGKIGVPDQVLQKNGSFTDEE